MPDYGDYVAPYVDGDTSDPRNKQAAGLPGPLAGYPPNPDFSSSAPDGSDIGEAPPAHGHVILWSVFLLH